MACRECLLSVISAEEQQTQKSLAFQAIGNQHVINQLNNLALDYLEGEI